MNGDDDSVAAIETSGTAVETSLIPVITTISRTGNVQIFDVDMTEETSNHKLVPISSTSISNNSNNNNNTTTKGVPSSSSLSRGGGGGGGKRGKDLVWSNVTMNLMEKKSSKKKNKNKKNGDGDDQQQVKLKILNSVWGKAEAGKTTAIMGASGAGKTSLFQTLAGRISSRGNLSVQGDIYLDGIQVDPHSQNHRKLFAYVSQEDSLHDTSTPREALTFSAKLRLPRTTTDIEIDDIVTSMIQELGLSSAADTIIGSGFRKGISGGEKRRVSIGIELVASPSILFLDEPTSGLDSYAAGQVMSLLDVVAKAGTTVLFTIHQPSSNIFGTFDRLILLHKGRVMHQGDVSDIADDFDMTYQQPIPPNYNPADWLVDVAQTHTIEQLETFHFFPKEPYGHKPLESKGQQHVLMIPDPNHVSVYQEFRLLQQREMKSLRRNPTAVLINVTLTSILAVIFGVIFLNVGRQDRSEFSVVQSQLGAIVNLLISTLMGQSNTAIFVFSSERPVFLREYSTNHYTIVPYFLSKLWSEALNSFLAIFSQTLITYWLMGFQMSFGQLLVLTYSLALTATAVAVMLGAFFDNPKNATGLYTLVVVPQFYFSGLFIAIDLIPGWVSWAQYLCSMTYAARLGFAYEFANCDESETAQFNCDAVLDSNNVQEDGIWWYWTALMGLFTIFRLGGIYVLRSKARY